MEQGNSFGNQKRNKSYNGGVPMRWVSNSNDAINLKLAQTEDEVFSEDGYFHPIFTNQVILFFRIRSLMMKNKFRDTSI